MSPFFWYANLSALKEPQNIFSGKLIAFLTCWAVSRDLKTGGLEEQDVKFFEELSLKCLHKSIIKDKIEVWQMQLLIEELPEILSCKYSIIEDIKEALKLLIPQFMEYRRMQNNWADYKLLEYIAQILNL